MKNNKNFFSKLNKLANLNVSGIFLKSRREAAKIIDKENIEDDGQSQAFYNTEAKEMHPEYLNVKESTPSSSTQETKEEKFKKIVCDQSIKMLPIKLLEEIKTKKSLDPVFLNKKIDEKDGPSK